MTEYPEIDWDAWFIASGYKRACVVLGIDASDDECWEVAKEETLRLKAEPAK